MSISTPPFYTRACGISSFFSLFSTTPENPEKDTEKQPGFIWFCIQQADILWKGYVWIA